MGVLTALARTGGRLGAAATACLSIAACGNLEAAGTFNPRTPGTLTVATAQIPDPGLWSGTPQHITGGFEYGLAKALASKLGLKSVKVKVVPFPRLVSGHLEGADIAISDITLTSQREQHLSFSSSYLAAPPAIVVRPGTHVPDVYTAQKLRWGVQQATTLLSEVQETIEPESAPIVFVHQREELSALRAGRVSAVMLDLPVALSYARQSPSSYAVAAQLPSEAVLAAALPKGSENVEAVDSALRALSSDGTIERLGRASLHIKLEEGKAEQVPVLRVSE